MAACAPAAFVNMYSVAVFPSAVLPKLCFCILGLASAPIWDTPAKTNQSEIAIIAHLVISNLLSGPWASGPAYSSIRISQAAMHNLPAGGNQPVPGGGTASLHLQCRVRSVRFEQGKRV
jgi:hypothetical protein